MDDDTTGKQPQQALMRFIFNFQFRTGRQLHSGAVLELPDRGLRG